jgi:hypothetical protein
MGLDTSHGCWHGAYSAFASWRDKMAEVAGYPMRPDPQRGGGLTYWDPRWDELPNLYYEPKIIQVEYETEDYEPKIIQVEYETEDEYDAAWEKANGDEMRRWSQCKIAGHWDTPPDDPLLILLIHSDCDGVIKAEHAAFLAQRLEQLLPLLPDDYAGGHIGDWREKTQEFIDGLRAAAEADEDVDFH